MKSRFNVMLFARARDLCGTSTVTVELADGATVEVLLNTLGEQYPVLRPLLPTLMVAVNENYASPDQVLDPSSSIACFPPVSGG
ncbi:MoaD/ThiS family protein [Planctomicrobium sp. SH668]|uniref:MoaD/ThiS family protein n=1 Tax=Planctomicrobium sp. SH668 TaxID=3448126 RepID=UPI003F5C2836